MVSQLTGFKNINKKLKEDFLCLPPYNSINGEFENKVGKDLIEGKEIKYHITAQIILPWRRAYQMVYRYRELDIFKPVLKVIEFVTVAELEGNYICSYLSLLPVIETLMKEWAKESPDLKFTNIKNYNSSNNKKLKKQFSKNIKDNSHCVEWIETYIDYLEYIISDVLYITDINYKNKTFKEIFNRNITLHSLENISNMSECLVNNVRLFLIIDVIAELYLRSNWDRYKKLNGIFDLNFNPELFDLYWKFYISRSHYGLEGSSINILHNVFLKENLTQEEIIKTRDWIIANDKINSMIKEFLKDLHKKSDKPSSFPR